MNKGQIRNIFAQNAFKRKLYLMRPAIILAALLLVATATQAKKLAGYVVFPNNDTLHGEIKVTVSSGFFSKEYNIYDEITITDSTARDSTYYPGQVTAFGFADKSGQHIFRSKMNRDSTMKFQQVIVAG